MPYAGATAPAGWLLCNGAGYNSTTYPTLYSVIATTYGAGNVGLGTNFNVPNLCGRIPLGAGANTGLTTRTLAATGGQEAITSVPQHNHSLYKVTGDHPAGSALETNVDYAIFGDYGEGTDNTFNTGIASVDVMNPFLVLNYIIKV
jgi:microcystin-dependent protein